MSEGTVDFVTLTGLLSYCFRWSNWRSTDAQQFAARRSRHHDWDCAFDPG